MSTDQIHSANSVALWEKQFMMGGWEWWRVRSEGMFGEKESEPDPPIQKCVGFCAETTTKKVKQLLPLKTLDPRDSVLAVLRRGGKGGSQSQQS